MDIDRIRRWYVFNRARDNIYASRIHLGSRDCFRRVAFIEYYGAEMTQAKPTLLEAIQELLSFELADQIEGDIDGAYLHQTHDLKAAIHNVKEAIAKIELAQTKGD